MNERIKLYDPELAKSVTLTGQKILKELIEKLAEQATVFVADYDGQRWQIDPEKFAELIVFECTNAVMDGTKEGDHYAMRIEQHFDNGQGGILNFGVEE